MELVIISSLISVVEKYRMDLIGVQEVRWEDDTLESGNHTFILWGK
jgi:hypothetical protein